MKKLFQMGSSGTPIDRFHYCMLTLCFKGTLSIWIPLPKYFLSWVWEVYGKKGQSGHSERRCCTFRHSKSRGGPLFVITGLQSACFAHTNSSTVAGTVVGALSCPSWGEAEVTRCAAASLFRYTRIILVLAVFVRRSRYPDRLETSPYSRPVVDIGHHHPFLLRHHLPFFFLYMNIAF